MARRRSIDEADADRAVRTALAAQGGVATRADLVVATALPEMVVERSLERLLDEHTSSVGVARGGTLLYRFAPGFPRRRERRVALRTLLAVVARTVGGVVRGARTVFRALLAIQLIVYMCVVLVPISVVVGVVAGIAFLVLAIFSEGGADILQVLVEPWGAAVVLGIAALCGIVWAFKKKYELLLELVGVRELDVQSRGLDGLVARVNAFAVGPVAPVRRQERLDRTWTISQADERRVLARLRAQGGRLRAGDLVTWLGLTLDEADSQATRLAVEYGGEPAPLGADGADDDADELGVLEFRFPSLLTTAEPAAPAEPAEPARRRGAGDARADEPTRFERAEPAARFTGNQPKHDTVIALFAIVNLVGGVVGHHFLGPARAGGTGWWILWVLAAPLPIGFSLLMFLLPLLRAPWHLYRRVRTLVTRARARLVVAIVAHARKRGARHISLEKLANTLPKDAELPDPSPAEVRAVALELGGEFDLPDGAEPSRTVWKFRRLAAELAASAKSAKSAAGSAEGAPVVVVRSIDLIH